MPIPNNTHLCARRFLPSLLSFLLSTRLPAMLCALLLAVLVAAAPALAGQSGKAAQATQLRETAEVWTGSVLSATFRIGMCTRSDGTARGVFLLTHKNGDTDVYHLHGHIRDLDIEVRHGSGHVLKANLNDPAEVRGSMRLKNGMRFSLKGKRHYNAPVSADCAPLP